jgi:5-methylcytosine-specific restriction protein A
MPDLPSPYSVTPRKPLTPKQRLQMFLDHNGICCLCGHKIDGVRERWIDEHELALWLGSLSEEDRERLNATSNRGPAHERCATIKTAKEATDRARGRKAAERHFGAKRPKKVMQGSRRSPWKKKLNGPAVRRWGNDEEDA